MTLRTTLLLLAVLGLQTPALAEEADLSDPIASSPDLTLRDLVPAAILERVAKPFNLQAEVMSNAPGQPFHATFDISVPDYPNVTMSLLVSERENVISLVSRIRSMADAGNLPEGSKADRSALADADCLGVVAQNMIVCMIGTAGIQFTASDFTGGDSIDYDAAKALFATIPLDAYRKVFGQ